MTSLTGILISSGSQPTIRHNRVFSGRAAGIEVTNGGGGKIEENDIFQNRFDGICLATGVKPSVLGEVYITCIVKYMYIIRCCRPCCTLLMSTIIISPRFSPPLPLFPPSGNRVHSNGRTLKDALQSGKCLFSISGDNSYPMHNFYRCLTCDSSESDAICVNCVKSCHRDHRVQFIRHDR